MVVALIVGGAVLGTFTALRLRHGRRTKKQLEQHAITVEELHRLLDRHEDVLLYDVRLPLDMLTDAEIIPGAHRISPKEVLENPTLIPRDKDAVVYCTCPGEESSKEVLHRALQLGYVKVRFLKGGLAAWKKKGYTVEPYERPFHLDTASTGSPR
jgi:rhodanese-related sulfurtransferase